MTRAENQVQVQMLFYKIKHRLIYTFLILTIVSCPWLNCTAFVMEILNKARSHCHKDHHITH